MDETLEPDTVEDFKRSLYADLVFGKGNSAWDRNRYYREQRIAAFRRSQQKRFVKMLTKRFPPSASYFIDFRSLAECVGIPLLTEFASA